MQLNTTKYDIHVFGDSHSRIYSSHYLSNYICKVYYVGPITMHRIGRDKITIDRLKALSKKYYNEYLPTCKSEYKHMSYPDDDNIKENDVVLFVFGEIDIRNHYVKQLQKGRSHSEIIANLTNSYISTIMENKKTYNNVKFGLQSINPPVDIKNIHYQIKDYPVVGTIEQRIQATNEINKLLKQKCKDNDLLFIDTATYYQNDESLFPVTGLSEDAAMYEMDNRIKDNNVHIHMENPEGIEHAFQVSNLPINIGYNKYKKKCKYRGSLNKYQRDFAIRLRVIHYVCVLLLLLTLFIPNRYFLITLTYWSFLLLLNIVVTNRIDCSIGAIEFRISNCNDISFLDEIGIPRQLQMFAFILVYSIGIIVLVFRTYYYFNKKNLFNIKFGMTFLK